MLNIQYPNVQNLNCKNSGIYKKVNFCGAENQSVPQNNTITYLLPNKKTYTIEKPNTEIPIVKTLRELYTKMSIETIKELVSINNGKTKTPLEELQKAIEQISKDLLMLSKNLK